MSVETYPRFEIRAHATRPVVYDELAALNRVAEFLSQFVDDGRLGRAIDLVLAESGVRDEGDAWHVASQARSGAYYVIEQDRDCPCEDAWFAATRVRGRAACKHQIAVWLAMGVANVRQAKEDAHHE